MLRIFDLVVSSISKLKINFRMINSSHKKALLIGVAGSNNAFSLSLYNLKSYAFTDHFIRKNWDIKIIQNPLISHLDYEKKSIEH